MLVARLSECYSPFSLLEAIFVLVIWYQQQVLKSQNCWLQNWFCHRRRGSFCKIRKLLKVRFRIWLDSKWVKSFLCLLGNNNKRIFSKMKWIGKLKQICRRPVEDGTEAATIGPEPLAVKVGYWTIFWLWTLSLCYVIWRCQSNFLNSKNLHLRPML